MVIAATLRLLPRDKGGVNEPLRSGFGSALILWDRNEDKEASGLGCEVEVVDGAQVRPGESREVLLKPWAPVETWEERIRVGETYVFWYGRDIGEVDVVDVIEARVTSAED